MADYQRMYLTLMRETEKAVRTLIAAQQHCEELYLETEKAAQPVLLAREQEKEGPSE